MGPVNPPHPFPADYFRRSAAEAGEKGGHQTKARTATYLRLSERKLYALVTEQQRLALAGALARDSK